MMNARPPPMAGNRPFPPNRPQMFNQGPQNMNNMNGPPRMNMSGPPAPHVNPAFFNQGGPMNPQQPGGPGHFNQQGSKTNIF